MAFSILDNENKKARSEELHNYFTIAFKGKSWDHSNVKSESGQVSSLYWLGASICACHAYAISLTVTYKID